ncbi:hypothetical protein GCM10011515_16310 [Tsuneonella deserti]|uniref:DUF72 domain-containing protein n=1 Tax=Tsuneonella deserti TaxID=2035528 RepID=A0ABQ1SAL0_9SPHN|nr:DUF72 domain-containing protein [Tsuneonella deserti]GGD97254.1 hypothetical protein GCM10011515_16310 [Tsuneonella deserti]
MKPRTTTRFQWHDRIARPITLAMTIRTGIGGWTYPAWRGGTFYPKGLRQADEQAFATRAVAAIEINATFYRLQKPENFAAWREVAPPGFVFSLKGSRYITNRKVLVTADQALPRFLEQGFVELGDKLGPIVWQLAVGKRFEPDDVRGFFALLPRTHAGLPLRHAVEVGHESFACEEFVELARAARVAIVYSEDEDRTPIGDRTADFSYMRLQRLHSDCATGYAPRDLDRLARVCRAWHEGKVVRELPHAGDPANSEGCAGDVFAMMINGAKERAPAAAIALAGRIGETG